MSFPFSMTEPTWLVCGCGAQTSIVPCWDCEQRALRDAESKAVHEKSMMTLDGRFAGVSIDDPTWAARVTVAGGVRAALQKVLSSRNVTFMGPSGSGKTTLACMALRERSKVAEAMFVQGWALEDAKQRAGFGRSSELFDKAIEVPVLLIDELKEKGPKDAIWSVVESRLIAGLITYVTLGLSVKQVKDIWGDGMVRRLFEPNCATVMNLGGGASA